MPESPASTKFAFRQPPTAQSVKPGQPVTQVTWHFSWQLACRHLPGARANQGHPWVHHQGHPLSTPQKNLVLGICDVFRLASTHGAYFSIVAASDCGFRPALHSMRWQTLAVRWQFAAAHAVCVLVFQFSRKFFFLRVTLLLHYKLLNLFC